VCGMGLRAEDFADFAVPLPNPWGRLTSQIPPIKITVVGLPPRGSGMHDPVNAI